MPPGTGLVIIAQRMAPMRHPLSSPRRTPDIASAPRWPGGYSCAGGIRAGRAAGGCRAPSAPARRRVQRRRRRRCWPAGEARAQSSTATHRWGVLEPGWSTRIGRGHGLGDPSPGGIDLRRCRGALTAIFCVGAAQRSSRCHPAGGRQAPALQGAIRRRRPCAAFRARWRPPAHARASRAARRPAPAPAGGACAGPRLLVEPGRHGAVVIGGTAGRGRWASSAAVLMAGAAGPRRGGPAAAPCLRPVGGQRLADARRTISIWGLGVRWKTRHHAGRNTAGAGAAGTALQAVAMPAYAGHRRRMRLVHCATGSVMSATAAAAHHRR